MNNGYYRNVIDANGQVCSGRDLFRAGGTRKNPFKNVTILLCADGKHVVPKLNLVNFDREEEWDHKKTVYENALAIQRKYQLDMEMLAIAFGIPEDKMHHIMENGEDFKISIHPLTLIRTNFNLQTEYYRQVIIKHCTAKKAIEKCLQYL
ncbi:hypothetical protein [Aerococcus urinae]|uniref:hypothetical protein n=1 Tax=Aerococcus urinae TaxID=1376 RepID=UPI002549D2E5|nr:hypothetical protein [Aerococcus urinae]MDK7716051.1 hypothetical protein [Aerococcus urinae]